MPKRPTFYRWKQWWTYAVPIINLAEYIFMSYAMSNFLEINCDKFELLVKPEVFRDVKVSVTTIQAPREGAV
jgi:hypothetical protein